MCFRGLAPTVLLLTISLLEAQTTSLNLRVVEGGGAINSIRFQRGHDPVVQVLDQNERPVAGAVVTFLLPASGAGAVFADNSLSLTATSDARGMATARGLKPNRVPGQFRIRVTASSHGASANTTILQTNAEPAPKSSNGKWIAIALVVGGAVAGGAVAASHGGDKSSTSAATTPPATTSSISAGAPSFGPPK